MSVPSSLHSAAVAEKKVSHSKDTEEADWSRLGNEQDAGGEGERETKDAGCQQVGRVTY